MASGFEEESVPFLHQGSSATASGRGREISFRAKIGPGGRIVIPADVRGAMGVTEGDVLLGELDGATLQLSSTGGLIASIQSEMRKLVPPGVSVVDEFLAERRAMWGEDED